MTAIMLAGAVAGTGVLLVALVLVPPRTGPAAALARLDADRRQRRIESVAPADARGWTRRLGRQLSHLLGGAGVEMGRLRSDLALLGRSLDGFLTTTVLSALGGLGLVLGGAAVLAATGIRPGAAAPALLGLIAAAVAAVVPFVSVRSSAARHRRDFRHVVGSFLDLVAMSLAGGRGIPEALKGASEISDGWAMVRIRDTLIGARLRGETPWSALGALGEEVRLPELRDLAGALALVAEDGAKVRDSLSARAGTMRRRELAESESKAGEASQSMLVAQLLLSVGFLIFLVYPAMVTVLGGG